MATTKLEKRFNLDVRRVRFLSALRDGRHLNEFPLGCWTQQTAKVAIAPVRSRANRVGFRKSC
jgi:hypothetical protein